LAAVVVCGAAPRETCDTRQAAQKAAEAKLSPSDRRAVGNFPPRIVERNNGLHWEVSWAAQQMGGRPVVKMVNRGTCAVISTRP
jgi:hypothetical protein